MASYTQINPDGTREIVKYNPHHDGPVSERITLVNRLRWLQARARRNPGDKNYKTALVIVQSKLDQFDRISRQSSVPANHHRGNSRWQPRTAWKQVKRARRSPYFLHIARPSKATGGQASIAKHTKTDAACHDTGLGVASPKETYPTPPPFAATNGLPMTSGNERLIPVG